MKYYSYTYIFTKTGFLKLQSIYEIHGVVSLVTGIIILLCVKWKGNLWHPAYAVCFQTFCYPVHRVTLQVFPEDALYNLRLLWIDDEIHICILGVAEEVIVIYLHLAALIAELESQLYVLAEGL